MTNRCLCAISICAAVLFLAPPSRAEFDLVGRRVAPHLVKDVEVPRGGEAEVLGKVTIIFFAGERQVYFTHDDLQKLLAEPDIESPKDVDVRIVDLKIADGMVSLPQFSTGSGLVITCRLRISAPPDALPGPRVVDISFPNLIETARQYRSPGWNEKKPSFLFNVTVWESAAVLAAKQWRRWNTRRSLRHRSRGRCPEPRPREAADRQRTMDISKWEAARERLPALLRPWFYVVEGAVFLRCSPCPLSSSNATGSASAGWSSSMENRSHQYAPVAARRPRSSGGAVFTGREARSPASRDCPSAWDCSICSFRPFAGPADFSRCISPRATASNSTPRYVIVTATIGPPFLLVEKRDRQRPEIVHRPGTVLYVLSRPFAGAGGTFRGTHFATRNRFPNSTPAMSS